jgi:hypothetical protein
MQNRPRMNVTTAFMSRPARDHSGSGNTSTPATTNPTVSDIGTPPTRRVNPRARASRVASRTSRRCHRWPPSA